MPDPHFRAGVVTVVRRRDGLLLACERADLPGQWQLPQGGMHEGESPEDAAWRELHEETGLDERSVRLTGERDGWTMYQYPGGATKRGRIGQAHRWFFFEPRNGAMIEPRVDGREFRDWRWMVPAELIEQVVEFRRPAYVQVLGHALDG